MKILKISIVVLFFIISMICLIIYFDTAKTIYSISQSSTMLLNEFDSNVKKVAALSTTKLTKEKEKQKIIAANTVTSRSGKHEPIQEVEQSKTTYEGIELQYNAVYNVSSSRLTKSKGATYYNGHKETYYSQKVLSGKGLKALNNNGRHVANDGTVRDGDGYIAVACNYLPKGSRIMTSLGPGKVYDTGGMTGKWIDIYVNW